MEMFHHLQHLMQAVGGQAAVHQRLQWISKIECRKAHEQPNKSSIFDDSRNCYKAKNKIKEINFTVPVLKKCFIRKVQILHF